MGNCFSTSIGTLAIAAATFGTAISLLATQTSAQAPANQALKTPWGEPDLQGIWTEEFDTPVQRPLRYANQEFFTGAQRQELDRRRAAHYGADPRQERGSAADVGGAYNTAFLTIKRVGPRTSMIVDPPNGRLPPHTPAAQRAAAADREFFLALLQSSDACKKRSRFAPEASTTPFPRRDFRNYRRATILATPRASIAAMGPRTMACRTAACAAGSRSSAASSAAAFAGSCRRPVAFRCSTM